MSSSARLLWFFVWRMALWGLGLGVAVMVIRYVFDVVFTLVRTGGGHYGAVLTIFGGVLSGAVGALLGLFLGLLCGVVLFTLARLHYRRQNFSEPEEYRRGAGRASALASALALLTEWQLYVLRYRQSHGGEFEKYGAFFDPWVFIVWRMFPGRDDVVHRNMAFDLTLIINLALMVVFPTLLFSLAMWWAGRRVAGRYVSQFGEAERSGQTLSAGPPPEAG